MVVKMSAPSVDVLGAHRSRQGSVRMPSPYDLQAIMASQHSSQAGSDSGSTNTHVTAPRKLSKRASLHGIDRQIHPVKRRSRSQIAAQSTAQSVSSVPTSGLTLSPAEKVNLDYAMNVYVAELCNTHSWPETNLSKTMAGEAFSQANAHARKHDRLTTDETDTTSFNRRVDYISSIPQTIFNMLSAD